MRGGGLIHATRPFCRIVCSPRCRATVMASLGGMQEGASDERELAESDFQARPVRKRGRPLFTKREDVV